MAAQYVIRPDQHFLAGPGGSLRSSHPTLHVCLMRYFDIVVSKCGGSYIDLLKSSGLPEDLLYNQLENKRISYDKFACLLNNSAYILGQKDFGLQLALEQSRQGFTGPLSIAMRNSDNVGSAFRLLADRIYTYSDCTGITLQWNAEDDNWAVLIDILPHGKEDSRQFVEQVLLSASLIASEISNHGVAPKKVLIAHEALAPPETYEEYFGATVSFSCERNAVVFDAADAMVPIPGRSEEVYLLATSFMDNNYIKPEEPLHLKVRRELSRHEHIGNASIREIAETLGMHPRTFQRRLRDEGILFNVIKDQVCQDLALKYLKHTSVPLKRIASILGYSELSAFSYRCHHWFACSPGKLRRGWQQPVSGKLPRSSLQVECEKLRLPVSLER
jgi:AraC-like DNA-binding protein